MSWKDVVLAGMVTILLGGGMFGFYSCEQKHYQRIVDCINAGHDPLQCKSALNRYDR